MNGLTHISLFTGIGGFDLAAEWAGFRTIAMCEIDPFCQEVLKARFGAVADTSGAGPPRGIPERQDSERQALAGHAGCRPELPILIPDIRDFDGTRFRGATLLTGGFPCQPFSHAGKRKGKEDDRHLWPQMLRVIREARPAWVLAENVAGLISMELHQVLADLEGAGYEVDPYVVPACAVNAPHRRDRVWIVARLDGRRLEGRAKRHGAAEQSRIQASRGNDPDRPDSYAPDAEGDNERAGLRAGEPRGERRGRPSDLWGTPWIEVATRLCRVDDGLPAWVHARRVARLKALGNAIVPQVAYQIIEAIAKIEGASQ